MSVMRSGFLVLASFLTNFAFAAGPPPEFSAAGVVRGAESAPILVPGAGLSIYGIHLGPVPGCAANADPKRRETINPRNPDPNFADLAVYPKELCGVQVLIGDKAAGLLYVSEKQINLKVPQESVETGMVELRVVSQGQSSASVRMPAGFEKTTVSLAEPAYVNMPVWLKVETRFGLGRVSYPSPIGPAGFGCNQVEVRRDGKLLPVLPGSNWMKYGGSFSGPPCGSYAFPAGDRKEGRLPLHLLYRFDLPGVYEVRYVARDRAIGPATSQIRAQSDWTPIEILPSTPDQRKEFLDAMSRRTTTDAAAIVTDILPNILGFPDDASFDLVARYLYHPFPAVHRYASDGLAYWPEDSTSARLLALLDSKGPSEELVRFLLRQPEFGKTHHAEIVAASLPYLESESSVAIDGALTAVQWPPASADPAVFEALLNAAERIVPRMDVQNRGNLVQTLAWSKQEKAHLLLRKLVDEGYDVAAEPLISFGDLNDLPMLGALLASPERASGDQLGYLPAPMYKTFGSAAVPYFEAALRASPGQYTQQSLALQLMAAGDPLGFQNALQGITSKGAARINMIRALKDQFPELKSSDDAAVLAFVQARAGN